MGQPRSLLESGFAAMHNWQPTSTMSHSAADRPITDLGPLAVASRPILPVALCVDLDGTLIRGDTLRTALRALILRKPWALGGVLWAATSGRVVFKKRVAANVSLAFEALKFRPAVVDFVRA